MKGQTWARAAGGERARALATSAIIMVRGILNFLLWCRGKVYGHPLKLSPRRPYIQDAGFWVHRFTRQGTGD